ncbi:MAG TPA: branched-chain amino acid ABC transporter permease [Candidatus Thermoplasmatota archaeon]|nr:branched-chain amino acid ABC transporter permease [Candidatus Thermoplasmatota archaeon]
MVDASLVLQYVANGIVFGGILSLAAIGLSLVYGILSLSNFAHGEFLTFGAFFAFLFAVRAPGSALPFALVLASVVVVAVILDRWRWRRLRRPEVATLLVAAATVAASGVFLGAVRPAGATTNLVLLACTVLAVAATVLLTVGLDLAVWRPLRRKRATILSLVIVSIGVALVIRNSLQIGFGTGNRSFARPAVVAEPFLGVRMLPEQQFTIVAAAVLAVLVHLFLRHTRYGRAMRALADDRDLARVSGVDVDRALVYVWALAGALAAVAGILLTLVSNNTMNVQMGVNIILALFAAVILGGIGSPYGAIAGGLVVGVAMKTSPLWIGSRYEFAAALIILILVLLVRPQGIFGGRAT